MLQSHTVGIGMYVAQFPDWARFTENAAAIQVSVADVPSLANLVGSIAGATDFTEIADPEVPRTLKQLKLFAENPGKSTSRAALAVVRTVENLVIRIFSYGADFIEKTAAKAVDSASTVSSKAIVGTLLAIGLSAALGLGPIAGKVEGMGWMKDAIEIVQRQLDVLKTQ